MLDHANPPHVPYFMNVIHGKNPRTVQTLSLVIAALIALASNSLFCRLALEERTIDPAGFTAVRLLSGAAMLSVLFGIIHIKKSAGSMETKGSWLAAAMLFAYAIAFSYAYIYLSAGTGALILFGATQISIILFSHIGGTRLHLMEWLGMGLAFSGLVYLVLPGVSAPPPGGFILMAAAGMAWGVYTLKGRNSRNPLTDTGWNFIRTTPFVVVLLVLAIKDIDIGPRGALLAAVSGAVTSGLGYVLWYAVVRGITSTQAAVIQLLIPVLTAIGGVVFLGERISWRLVFSALLILGGIAMVVWGRSYFVSRVRK